MCNFEILFPSPPALTLLARAVVVPDGVPADVLAAAVVGGALVLVGEEGGGEARLLDGVVREELEAERVALGGDHGREAGAAVEAVAADLAGAHGGGQGQGVVLAVLLNFFLLKAQSTCNFG